MTSPSFSNSYKTSDKLLEQLAEVRISGVDRTYEEVTSRLTALSKAAGVLQEDVYLISDYQKSTGGGLQFTRDSMCSYFLLPQQFENTVNVSVDSIYLKNPFVLDKNKVTMNVVVRNYGNEPAPNLPLKVIIEGVQVSATTLSLDGCESKLLTFDITYDLKS